MLSVEKVYDELYGMIEDLKKQIEANAGTHVTITPALESGTKIADFSIGEEESSLYAPTPGDPLVISTTETKIGTYDGKDLYAILFKDVSITNTSDNILDADFSSDNDLVFYSVTPRGTLPSGVACELNYYNNTINDTLYVSSAGLTYYFDKTGGASVFSTADIMVMYTKPAETRSKKKK